MAVVARTPAAQHALSREVAAAVDRAVRTTATTGDPRPCTPWGGFNPARRILISLRKRADLEDSGGGSGARIDGYSTHHARHLGPQSLA